MTLEAAICPCNPAAGTEAPCLVLALPQGLYSLALKKINMAIFILNFMVAVAWNRESQLFDGGWRVFIRCSYCL